MNQKNLKDNMLCVRCDNCKKPFHITAKPQSKKTGEEEIALNCPYCNEALIVKVPQQIVKTDVIFRGERRKGKN
jgi:DNA-directed RNA polymerase subunit RPC12/RpoP